MRSRPSSWTHILTRLGLRRRARRPQMSGPVRPRGAFESLEPRQMLAADYMVTTHLDVVNANDGVLSLREAVTAAGNDGQSDIDDIEFASNVVTQGRISLAAGQMTLTSSVNIVGPGAALLTIDANEASRVFSINADVEAAISGLTITGGGAVTSGGGVHNLGDLTLESVVVSGNHTILTSAGTNVGGGIYSDGTLRVRGSTIIGNQARYGGGLNVSLTGDDVLEITDSTIANNVGLNTVTSGQPDGLGGGLLLGSYGTIDTAQATITNSTFSGNRSKQGAGLSIREGLATANMKATIANSTITDNRTQTIAGAGLSGGYAGGIQAYSVNGTPDVTLHNTILAGNTSTNTNFHDVWGTLQGVSSHNIIGQVGSSVLTNNVNGNKVGTSTVHVDAKLAALANNGGPTLTHALLGDSPAIDAGKDLLAAVLDQRGFGRPVDAPAANGVGGTSDIGAYEYGVSALLDAAGKLRVDDSTSRINSIVLTVGVVADRTVVKLNGKATPFAVGDVTAIEVIGGEGNDAIDLSGVDAVNLPKLVDVFVDGGLGNDDITGTSGDDRITGGDGANMLVGGLGDDKYAINDKYFSTLGRSDEIEDAGGVDTLDFTGWAGASGVVVDLAKAAAAVQNLDGVTAKVRLIYTQANQTENVIGSAAADTIHGNSLENSLFGMGGNDVLHGYAGNDRLDGGHGDDQLYGGAGAGDVYDGGPGNDAADDPDISDIDTDGLSNTNESAAGTDATDSDTDGDGLADGFETDNNNPGTPGGELDPTESDSDGDDVGDGQEDPDGDGATNDQEQGGGTDPNDSSSTPEEESNQWRTYGDATIADGILTVGQVDAGEHDIQPARFHGASIALEPEDSYTFKFDLDLFTWDSYNASAGSGTGYWDSFSISVTSLPYDTLQLDDDPLAYPFIWGGTNYLDRNLETRTEDDLTLTFEGDGENKMYLNLVLDTSNPPQTDGEFPSWGTFTLPPMGKLTAHRPMHQLSGQIDLYAPFSKTPVLDVDERKVDLGPGIRINGDDDPLFDEDDLIEVTVERVTGQNDLVLKRTSSDIKAWYSTDNQIEIVFDSNNESSPIDFLGANVQDIYIEWAGSTHGDAEVSLVHSISDAVLDTLKFHTFTSVVIALGGEGQAPSDPADGNHGIFDLANRLYRSGYDVQMYDEDAVTGSGAGQAYNDIVSAIQNRSVTSVAIFGYSHGGGSTHDLSEHLNGDRSQIGVFTIAFTSYVDAVGNMSDADISQENRRPPGSQYHINQYQHQAIAEGPTNQVDGGPTVDPETGLSTADWELDVETTAWGSNSTHGTIDDFTEVKSKIESELKVKTTR